MAMVKRRSQPKKLNNDGMTLMEILIASIIFSLVSLVFLRSFVYAFQLNEQAKQRQYSLVLAQSLMESVKAYGVTSLDEQFYGQDASGASVPFKVYNLTDGASKSDPSISGNERIYFLNDVVYESAKFGNRYKYDAQIEMKPSTETKYTAKLLKTQDVNAYSDAIYVEPDNEQYKVQEDIIAELTAQGNTTTISVLDNSKVALARTLNVEISSDDIVTVTPVFDYTVSDYPITKTGGIAGTASFTGTTTLDPIICYDGATLKLSGTVFQNFYFYYYPAYNCSDEIYINNESSTLKNLYLLKQESPSLSVTEIDAYEGSYSPSVTIQSSGGSMVVLHNLNKQLHSDTIVAPAPLITNANPSAVHISAEAPWEEKAAETDTVLLYDVTVKVFKSGGSEPICELVGSTNAK